jgi:hypothetical protein
MVADDDGLVEVFEADCVPGDVREAIVIGLRTTRHDKIVVPDGPRGGIESTLGKVDAFHLREAELEVPLCAEDGPDGIGDLARGQSSGRDLVQERLEEVIVAAIDQHDVDGRATKGHGNPEAAKAGADYSYYRPVNLSHGPFLSNGAPPSAGDTGSQGG